MKSTFKNLCGSSNVKLDLVKTHLIHFFLLLHFSKVEINSKMKRIFRENSKIK